VETPRLYGQTWQASVDLDFDQVSRHDVVAFLRHQSGVTGWTFGNHDDATIDGRATPAIVLSAGAGPAKFPTLLEGRAPRNARELILGTTTLARLHRDIGDTVTARLQEDNTPRHVRIVGRAVFPFFGQGEVTPTGLGEGVALLAPHDNADGFNFFLVNLTPDTQNHDNLADLSRSVNSSRICNAGCSTRTAQRPSDISNYARIQRTPLVLAAVLSLLAFASIAHLLVTSIQRRRRDLAVLKALGFERRQVSAAIRWQATIVATLALLIGLPIGVLAGLEIWRWFANGLGVAPNASVPLAALVVAVPIVLLIANAIAAAPAWAAARVRPSTVLRAE
jgi:putative ABC transport system permease protein